MALVQPFALIERPGMSPPGGGPPRTHAILEGAMTTYCGIGAPQGFGPAGSVADWSAVTCPMCLAKATQPTR
jgi:hypothetical protein